MVPTVLLSNAHAIIGLPSCLGDRSCEYEIRCTLWSALHGLAIADHVVGLGLGSVKRRVCLRGYSWRANAPSPSGPVAADGLGSAPDGDRQAARHRAFRRLQVWARMVRTLSAHLNARRDVYRDNPQNSPI
jgi:hypothetical protein